MEYEFKINELNEAYGRCWFGTEHPNEVRGSKATIEAFMEFMRGRGHSGKRFNGADVIVFDGMQDGLLHFVNVNFPRNVKLNTVVWVGKEPEATPTARARGEGA